MKCPNHFFHTVGKTKGEILTDFLSTKIILSLGSWKAKLGMVLIPSHDLPTDYWVVTININYISEWYIIKNKWTVISSPRLKPNTPYCVYLIIKVPRVTLPPLPHFFGSIMYNKWEITSLDPQVKILAILITIRSEFMCLSLAGFSINTDSDKSGWWKPINTISTLHFCTASQDYRWLTTGEYVRSKN